MSQRYTGAIAIIAAVLLLAGCASGAKPKDAGPTGTITVLAASSLTGTFDTIGAQFERDHPGTHIRFSFGASGTLATQIDQGAPADVFASAAPKNMQTVVAAKYATSSAIFARNTAEIAAAPGNPAHITAVADLAKPGVKVAVCEPTVPCGAVAAEVLKNAGITVRPVSENTDVKATLSIVELGEVDAGVVYVTDVRAAGNKVVGVPIPASVNAVTDYPIAVLTHATNPALAAAFVAYVQSSAGRAVLTAAGFMSP